MFKIFVFLIFCFIFNRNIIKCEGESQTVTITQDQEVTTQAVDTSVTLDTEDTRGATGSVDNRDTDPTSGSGAAEQEGPGTPITKPADNTGTNISAQDKTSTDDPKTPDSVNLNPTTEGTTPTSENGKANSEAALEKEDSKIPIKSALLKNDKGIKVIGSCGQYFQLNFIPFFTFSFDTKVSKLVLDQKFTGAEQINIQFGGKCLETQTFKVVVKLKSDILSIKWKVKDANGNSNHKEIKKFRVPTLERPVTAIQIHSSKGDGLTIESKNYNLKNIIPEKCDAIVSECFLSGHFDIENCFHCEALVRKENDCLQFVADEDKKEFEKNIESIAQDDENSSVYKLRESIDNILKKVFKKSENKRRRKLITEKELDDELKEELTKYCNLLKEVDTSGTLQSNELGNETEVFRNLMGLLKLNSEENDFTLRNKLKIAAICIKNVKEWANNKRGLTIPKEGEKYYDAQKDSLVVLPDEEPEENEKPFTEHDNKTDAKTIIDLTKDIKVLSPYYIKNKYCNDEYCDRWKDRTSCVSKIEVEDQGECGVCWIYSSKLHFETIRCMRGHGHFRSSSLFVANCSKRKENKCEKGSNPFEFLEIITEQKFLPLESDYPFSYSKVNQPCPLSRNKWTNLWGETELSKDEYGETSHKGFYYYSSHDFRRRMDLFIKLVKLEIQNKGSAIIYIKTKDVFGYDSNGRDVKMLCGSTEVDHAANIIGYGNYINNMGEKRSYWLVRNSWGYYWGDQGNVRIDMYGPPNCVYNYIHSVLTFRINLGMIEPPKNDPTKQHNYFDKKGPYFYHQLYYKNFDQQKFQLSQEAKNLQNKNKRKFNNLDNSVNNFNNTNVESNLNNEKTVYAADEEDSNEEEFVVEANVNQVQVLHSLKDVKKNVIKKNLVTYTDEDDLSSEYSCSRVYSINGENDEKCKQFCKDNFDKCKDQFLPGYCLTKLKGDNECFFCSL